MKINGHSNIANTIRNRKIAFLGIGLFILGGCSLAPKPFIPDPKGSNNYQDAIRYSREYCKQYVKKSGIVGMAVAVVDSDRVVYSEGFGYGDKGKKRIATDSTTFLIGSVTKLFTATAIMQLVEQGIVVLDSPITTYLPEFTVKTRFNSRPITVRDLLTHESGLPSDILNGWYIAQTPCAGADTMYRTVPELLSHEYSATPPRTVNSYSNISFSLLGTIIDRMSKTKYSEYIRDNLFAKLGMNHSTFDFNDERAKSTFSKGYIGKQEEPPFYIRDISAGAMVSSVVDLSLFIKTLIMDGTLNGRRMLSSELLHQMWLPQNSDVPLDFITVGLGYWLINTTRIPSRIVQHDGCLPPHKSSLMVLPDAKIGVVVLINTLQGDPQEPAEKLLETFYEAKTGKSLPSQQTPKTQPVVKLSEKRLNEIAGFYQAITGPTKAEIKGNDIRFTFFGKPVTLIPHSDSTASLQYKLFGLIPISNTLLRELSLETHTIGEHDIVVIRKKGIPVLIAEKYIPQTPPKEWLSRVGKYEIVNERKVLYANKDNENKYKVQNLAVSYDSTNKDLRFCDVPIKPISPTEAVTCGVGRSAGETVRAYDEGGKEYLWAWGFALKKIPVPGNTKN